MSRIVLLPSGTIVDVDRIIFTPKDNTRIGSYVLVLAGLPLDMGVVVEGSDIDALIAAGLVQKLESPPKLA